MTVDQVNHPVYVFDSIGEMSGVVPSPTEEVLCMERSSGDLFRYHMGNSSWNNRIATSNYNNLTNKPTIPTVLPRSFNNSPGRGITNSTGASGFQISATRDASVSYSPTITTSVQIGLVTNVEAYVVLEVAPTNSATPSDWVEISRVSNGQSIGLALAFSSSQKVGGALSGKVPAGYYAKIRHVNVAGTASSLLNGQQEVLE